MTVQVAYNVATALPVGPFKDATDALTPLTGLDVTKLDVDLYKFSNTHPLTRTNLTLTASGGDNDCAHVANGIYSLEITADNLDTRGWGLLTFNVGTATAFVPFVIELQVGDIMAEQLADSIPADGVLPTRDQALYMRHQYMTDREIVDLTTTVYKADGTTPLFTLTQDHASTPTKIHRAT